MDFYNLEIDSLTLTNQSEDSGDYGIAVSNCPYTSIQNCSISNFRYGISYNYSGMGIAVVYRQYFFNIWQYNTKL